MKAKDRTGGRHLRERVGGIKADSQAVFMEGSTAWQPRRRPRGRGLLAFPVLRHRKSDQPSEDGKKPVIPVPTSKHQGVTQLHGKIIIHCRLSSVAQRVPLQILYQYTEKRRISSESAGSNLVTWCVGRTDHDELSEKNHDHH